MVSWSPRINCQIYYLDPAVNLVRAVVLELLVHSVVVEREGVVAEVEELVKVERKKVMRAVQVGRAL